MRRELNWMMAALAVVGLEYGVALAIGYSVGFQFTLPTKSYVIVTGTIAASALVLILLARLAHYGLQKEPHPAYRLLSDARFHAPWLFSMCFAFVLVGMQIGALTWLKVMLPIAQGFWADPLLANTERMLLGRDAWLITHALFGWATAWIDRVYVTWMPIKLVTLILVILAPLSVIRARALLSYFLVMAISCLSQYLLPSGGPVFYERLGLGKRFGELPIEPWVATARDYLWADYVRPHGEIGAGISAMPSMHVAIALWVALVLRSYSGRLQWLGWVWFGTIFIGSVHLGWHYALDSIAATAIALIAFKLADLIVNRPGLGLEAPQPGMNEPRAAILTE
jgi:hypothetical protein